MTNAPTGAALLLDFIGKTETGVTGEDMYRTIYGHKEGRLTKPITAFTVDELLDAQKLWAKNWRGSAAGKYQIIRKTLLGLVAEMGVKGSQKFTPELQDAMGLHLLRRRGWDKFATGEVTLRVFAHSLAKEWASLPVLSKSNGAHRSIERGQSYYAGDGLNKALVSPEAFEAVLSDALKAASKPVAAPKPVPVPAPTPVEEHEEPIAPPPASPPSNPVMVLIMIALAAAGIALWYFFGGA